MLEKTHYKLHKVGKHWVAIAVTVISITGGSFVLSQGVDVKAAEVATNQSVASETLPTATSQKLSTNTPKTQSVGQKVALASATPLQTPTNQANSSAATTTNASANKSDTYALNLLAEAEGPLTVSNNFSSGPFNGTALITINGVLNGSFSKGDQLHFNLPAANVAVSDVKQVTFNGAEAYGAFSYDTASGVGTYVFNKDFPKADAPVKFNLNWYTKNVDSKNNAVTVETKVAGKKTPVVFDNGVSAYDTVSYTDVDKSKWVMDPVNSLYGYQGAGNDNFIGSGYYLPTGQMTFSAVLDPGSGTSNLKDRVLTITPTNGGKLTLADVYFQPRDSGKYQPIADAATNSNGNMTATPSGDAIVLTFKDGYPITWNVIGLVLKEATNLTNKYALHFKFETSTPGDWEHTDDTITGQYQNNAGKGFMPNIQGNTDHEYVVGQITQSQLTQDLMKDVVANDVEDGSLTNKIVMDASAVKIGVPGHYQVTYTATDSDGNESKVSSIVTIKANDKKSITGDSVTIHVGDPLPDDSAFHAAATDENGQPETVTIDTSAVKTDTVGDYNVRITAADGQTKDVQVHVVPKAVVVPPVTPEIPETPEIPVPNTPKPVVPKPGTTKPKPGKPVVKPERPSVDPKTHQKVRTSLPNVATQHQAMLPQTGDDNRGIVAALGLSVLIATLGVLIKQRRQ